MFGETLTRASGNAEIVNRRPTSRRCCCSPTAVVVRRRAADGGGHALGAATGAHLAAREGDRLVRAVVLVVVAAIAVKLAIHSARG